MPKCKICSTKFTARFSSFQKTCEEPSCIIEWSKLTREKEAKKEHVAWKKEAKEKLMTLSDYIQICQKVFNTYIRMRDKDKPCISSGRPLKGKYDAGHYFSTGAYPNLRFHEDNVHGQSVHDNRDLHGNLIAYREGLIKRIGIERFEALERLKQVSRHYTTTEVKELIKQYRNKIKEICKK
jgi:Bacteriophage Lambda NinG protein